MSADQLLGQLLFEVGAALFHDMGDIASEGLLGEPGGKSIDRQEQAELLGLCCLMPGFYLEGAALEFAEVA